MILGQKMSSKSKWSVLWEYRGKHSEIVREQLNAEDSKDLEAGQRIGMPTWSVWSVLEHILLGDTKNLRNIHVSTPTVRATTRLIILDVQTTIKR